nr:MAG: hypothetical protein [Marsupenaeus japonicus endogenous nimavirus]
MEEAIRKVPLVWELLDMENYKLSSVIKQYDLGRDSVVYDIIKENVKKMYRLGKQFSPSYHIPDDNSWDEYTQPLTGESPPLHVDPHNFAYYYYLKLQNIPSRCETKGLINKLESMYENEDKYLAGTTDDISGNKKNDTDMKDYVMDLNYFSKLNNINELLAELISEKNIQDGSILHQIIKRNVYMLYDRNRNNIPTCFLDGDKSKVQRNYWSFFKDEQDLQDFTVNGNRKPPPIEDPHNIAFYYYLRLAYESNPSVINEMLYYKEHDF